MANAREIKDAYDYTPEDVRQVLPEGTYQFHIESHVVDYWKDTDRPRLQLSTSVVGGDHDGLRGPRIQMDLEVEESRTQAKKDGGSFTVTRAGSIEKCCAIVFGLNDGVMVPGVESPTPWDSQTLEEIGQGLEGLDFIAPVTEDKNGYNRFGKFHSLNNPPANFVPDSVLAGFV